MSDIQCAYPGPPPCPNLVEGKGLFCPLHQPSPGHINRTFIQAPSAAARVEAQPTFIPIVVVAFLVLFAAGAFSGVLKKLFDMLVK